MKKFAVAILFILPFILVQAQNKKVLFIGNSYTAANNLPQMIVDLALSTGDAMDYQAHTPGGARFLQHAVDPTVFDMIRSENWDYVVLQAQSQEPSWPISQVSTEVFPYAKILCDSIRAINPCSIPLFYMTWGRKNGDQMNCASWPPVCTYEGMDSLLNLRYRMMANDNNAYVSPVGEVWKYIRKYYPTLELYEPDESHPSAAGSYVAACAFYTLIFEKDPIQIFNNLNLSLTDAMAIRAATRLIVFDSLSKWNVGKYVPKADFDFVNDSNRVAIANNSNFGLEYKWYFGDGESSTHENPIHYYDTDGEYTIQLFVSKCGAIDSFSKKVTISTIGFACSELDGIILFPNPTTGIIEISNAQEIEHIVVLDQQGRMVMSKSQLKQDYIDISILDNGIYFLKIQLKNQQAELVRKVLKE